MLVYVNHSLNSNVLQSLSLNLLVILVFFFQVLFMSDLFHKDKYERRRIRETFVLLAMKDNNRWLLQSRFTEVICHQDKYTTFKDAFTIRNR